ncbi:MAG: hypothetical protein C4321_06115 [Chloroflexota bacterium]
MLLQFSHPQYLWLFLPLAAWVVWLARFGSMADLAPGRARLSLALRLALTVLVLLGPGRLAGRRPSRELVVLFVLDRSDSIPPERKQAAVDFVNRAAERMGPNDKAGVIVFGSDAFVEADPKLGLKLRQISSVPSTEYTDIGAAIQLALADFPPNAQKRVVLLSDGNDNLGEAVSAAAQAAGSGVQIDTVPLTYQYAREVMLDKIVAPADAKEGEPFEVKIIAASTYPTNATLRLFRDGQYIGAQSVHLEKGKNVFIFPQSLAQARFHTFEARIEAGEDTIAENNVAMGFTNVRGRPRVLYIANDPGDARLLASALNRQKIEIDVRGPGGLPTNLAELQGYDSIILDNVGAYTMTPDQMKMIQSNVRDLGAGLVMIGGENSFGAGAYGGTPIEAALPVDMDVQKKKNIPTGAVAMIMHTCEFLDGNQWAAETAAAVIDVMGAKDKVGELIWGGMGDQWVIPMQEVGDPNNKERLKGIVYQAEPSDMPSFQPSMQLALQGLRQTDAQTAIPHRRRCR